MILLKHLARLVRSVVRFGVESRSIAPILLLLLGGLIVAVAAASASAAPFVLYPFL